ncbi:MAG: LysM peptidoglycan-binding domain-containing protein [Candidatus Omnitrophota bacterium]
MVSKMRFLMVVLAAVAVSGCVQTRAYIAERERVDQDIPGIPAPAKPKTRQVFVVEVTEKGSPVPAKPLAPADAAARTALPETKPSVIPASKVEAVSQGTTVDAAALPTEYKVEKDDTLQKISKKLYGSYSKWTRIYDANKEAIKNPNFVKPGTLLKIPAAE